MGWDTASSKNNRLHTPTLRWRLLLSYLTVMLTILGISALGIYQYTRRSLYQQLDERLEILAQAASHNLLSIKTHYRKRQEQGLSHLAPSQTRCYLDDDDDLDIPWQQLRQPAQGVEWFDPSKQLVGNSGTLVTKMPPQPGYETWQRGRIRAVTLTVYSYRDGKPYLEGYIRATQITQEVETILSRLRWGLASGGILVLGLTGLGGIWLTKQSLKPIQQSFQQLQQFTADAAHELRSPLAAIKTSIQVMQCYPERLHPQDLKKIRAIATTTDHTIQLIEDLLLLARIDEAKITETQQGSMVSLREICDDLLPLFQALAHTKEITLDFNFLKEVSVQGNPSQLSRLLRNLLDNALQYTAAGGQVTLTVTSSDRHAMITVEDTGIGIAPEDLPLIFDRFWRADKARSRRAGGMGMGLSIARAIAQRHRGDISVSSQLGVGSSFRVRLPL